MPEEIHGECLAQVPGARISEFPCHNKFEWSKGCSIANCISEEEIVSRPLYCKLEQGARCSPRSIQYRYLADKRNHKPFGHLRMIFLGEPPANLLQHFIEFTTRNFHGGPSSPNIQVRVPY